MSGVILIVENYFSPPEGGARGGANIIFPGGGRWLKARWGDIKSE